MQARRIPHTLLCRPLLQRADGVERAQWVSLWKGATNTLPVTDGDLPTVRGKKRRWVPRAAFSLFSVHPPPCYVSYTRQSRSCSSFRHHDRMLILCGRRHSAAPLVHSFVAAVARSPSSLAIRHARRPPISLGAAMPATTSASEQRPQPVVMCGPSGVGKSTLIKRLFGDFPDTFGFSVSRVYCASVRCCFLTTWSRFI